MSKEQFNKIQRERRKKNGNAATHKYEKTKNGFLMRVYRNMLSRVTGVQWKKAHLYFGLPIMPKEEFYEWAKADEIFNELFDKWTLWGYDQLFTPSIDRIDSKLGYLKGNVRWLIQRENSRNATMARHQRAS